MKRATSLAMAAFLAMLVLAPMASAQGTTFFDYATNGGEAPPRTFRRVVLPSFCRRPRCFSGRAS